MDNIPEGIIKSKSKTNYDYATITLTQSRIDKGLLALPVSLSQMFPDHNETIQVYLNDSPISQIKNYSSFMSSTRECRIGGVREWFNKNDIKSGDEIVIQFLDKGKFIYRLIPERNFISKIHDLQQNLDKSENEREVYEKVASLAIWTGVNENQVIFNEYYRLANNTFYKRRKSVLKSQCRVRESVPVNLRILLGDIYQGHCQVCDFWFMNRVEKPYFEIHHIDPTKGHHPKNLLTVCGNCHNQFEHAHVKQEFNDDLWLIKVKFNEIVRSVNQALLNVKVEGFFKTLFV